MPVGESVVLGENRNRGPFAAELGAKRSLEAANFALDLESQFGRGLGQYPGGENLLELELRMLVNLVAERDHFVAVIIDRARDLGVSVHTCAPLDAASIVSSTDCANYPSRVPADWLSRPFTLVELDHLGFNPRRELQTVLFKRGAGEVANLPENLDVQIAHRDAIVSPH